MTRECEMLLKKMLVLNPAKRISLTEVMRDPWLNTGFDAVLRPFTEPPADYCDPERIETMVRLGFQRHEIQEALTQQRFNNITATYILLSRYDPQVHGRLPGLSNGGSRSNKSESHSRSRQSELSPASANNGPLTSGTHGTRPSSALPATAHSVPPVGSHTRRTSFASSRPTVDTAGKDQSISGMPSASSIATSTTTGNVAVTTTVTTTAPLSMTPVTASGPIAACVSTVSSAHPAPSVRRSATMAEYADRKSNSPSQNFGGNSGGLSFVARSPPPSMTNPASYSPPPSQAPPQEFPPPSHAPPAQASVIIHPTSVTAHLTLINPTNGPSCVAPPLSSHSPAGSPAPNSVQPQSVLSRVRPLPRKLSSQSPSSVGPTAPLAQSEDDPTSGGTLRSPGWLTANTNNKSSIGKCNGSANGRRHDPARTAVMQSSSDDSQSDSDVYDREWGSSASSDSEHSAAVSSRPRANHHSHHRRHPRPRRSIRRRTPTADSQPGEQPPGPSVVLAAAPHPAGTSRSNSKPGSTGPVIQEDKQAVNGSCRESNFTRMPSVRRRSSIRNRANTASMPAATGNSSNGDLGSSGTTTTTTATGATTSTCGHPGINDPSGSETVKTTASPVSSRFGRGPNESNYEGILSGSGGDATITPKDHRYPVNVAPKPRGLFRGPPNAADILR
ncbi:unnamed protein product [Echinostoma caproni]|uniref:non-specific serine/threonine protein kinase n=1 Tax=Echinostoma caproni TaxID=27848 RepID=A0A183ADV5_9TREM|nr:unnamed protein product [Echinostoma caproni]